MYLYIYVRALLVLAAVVVVSLIAYGWKVALLTYGVGLVVAMGVGMQTVIRTKRARGEL